MMDVKKPAQEWDVTLYQSQHSFVYEYGMSLVDLAIDVIKGEKSTAKKIILDVGCGSGELTNALLYGVNDDKPVEVIGMDLDPNMVKKAKEQYPHLSFFQEDVRTLSPEALMTQTAGVFPKDEADKLGIFTDKDPCVDFIFSNAALHWVPPVDAELAVSNLAKVLKPGGQFVVEFGGTGNVKKITQACQEETGVPTTDIWNFASIAQYSSLLEKHGIEVTKAWLYDRPTVLMGGKEGLSNWIRMFGKKYFEGMQDRSHVDNIMEKINENLHNDLFDQEGEQWIADYRRIRVVGRKREG